MVISEARKIFEAGGLKSAIIFRGYGIMNNTQEWWLELQPAKGDPVFLEAEKKSGATRIFKSVNAAVNAAKQIGFDSVTVEGLQR